VVQVLRRKQPTQIEGRKRGREKVLRRLPFGSQNALLQGNVRAWRMQLKRRQMLMTLQLLGVVA
jgi:hypothetical protein